MAKGCGLPNYITMLTIATDIMVMKGKKKSTSELIASYVMFYTGHNILLSKFHKINHNRFVMIKLYVFLCACVVCA